MLVARPSFRCATRDVPVRCRLRRVLRRDNGRPSVTILLLHNVSTYFGLALSDSDTFVNHAVSSRGQVPGFIAPYADVALVDV